jgi:midasin (ATPase involved in ribosome maturation)
MGHPVKCYFCGERFDRDFEPFIKVNANRYAHERCAIKAKKKSEASDAAIIFKNGSSISVEKEKKEVDKDMPRIESKNANLMTDAMAQTTAQMIKEMQKFMMSTIAKASEDEIMNIIVPKIDARIKEVYGFLPEKHEIKTPTETRKIEGTLHEKFDEVLQIVNLDIPVYLTGKAGTGKNVICKQVAEALGLDFYFTNAVTQEYKLTGFIDANGKYQETQFYKAFTKGGVFFLDEMDGSIPEVLIILNAAIANRYFDFPIGKVEAHPNFRIIAAGNTLGTGADNNYTGRYCLDRASLDRFALINIDYSPKIEKAMALNNMDLVNFAHAFRKATDSMGIECLFSYRTINRIAKLEQVFSNLKEVIQISLLKGMDVDDLNIINKELAKDKELKGNKYVEAMKAK